MLQNLTSPAACLLVSQLVLAVLQLILTWLMCNGPRLSFKMRGGTTEADWNLLQREEDTDDITGDSKDSQLQNSAGISTGITIFGDEPNAMQEHFKHWKLDSAGDAYLQDFNVGAIYGAQPAFSAVVDTLVDRCNMGFDAGKRLKLQVVISVVCLQREESSKIPWGEVPCRQLRNHAKPMDAFGLLVLGSFNMLAFCTVAQAVGDKLSRLTRGGLSDGWWFSVEQLEADWVMDDCIRAADTVGYAVDDAEAVDGLHVLGQVGELRMSISFFLLLPISVMSKTECR